MYYKNYKESRDMVWKLLIKEKIDRLPIKILPLCKHTNVKVISYSKGQKLLLTLNLLQHSQTTDGFTLSLKGKNVIFYDDDCSLSRTRFTIAHELGHILLNHIPTGEFTLINRDPSPKDNPLEQAANIFASRLLAPACILWGLHITTAEQIAKMCNISQTAAEFRADRILRLYKRDQQFYAERGHGCFLLSPLERQVYEQFKPYIETQIKNRPQSLNYPLI